MSDKFYITTAIDYPNGNPHIGHAYEKVVTDSYARWYRLLGKDVHYLTGTDENGQKLIESAQAAGIETKDFVDKNAEGFKNFCETLNISHNDFIRTTEERHIKVAQDFWNKLDEKGDVYHGKYSGNYCIACEAFYTDSQAPDGICPEHNTKLELKEEEGFFFKMSAYQEWIVDYLKSNPNFVVPSRAHKEILRRVEQDDIRDLAISRPNETGWGVPVPGNEKFVMYTWFDAVINYYSAVEGKDRWPADVHVIGKDIIWFHCVIWPCMLQAAGIELPKQVYVHGMVLGEDGRKMSKSVGNVVAPQDMLSKYPLDTFRYYLLRAISSSSDGSFSEKELVDKHNNELGNDFGNLIMRVVKLSMKIIQEPINGTGIKQEVNFDETFDKMNEYMSKREHNKALDVLWEKINFLNQYVNEKAPWKLKEDLENFKSVIYNCLYGIHYASTLLGAYLPDTALKSLESLGIKDLDFNNLKFGDITYHLSTPEPLFPKIEFSE